MIGKNNSFVSSGERNKDSSQTNFEGDKKGNGLGPGIIINGKRIEGDGPVVQSIQPIDQQNNEIKQVDVEKINEVRTGFINIIKKMEPIAKKYSELGHIIDEKIKYFVDLTGKRIRRWNDYFIRNSDIKVKKEIPLPLNGIEIRAEDLLDWLPKISTVEYEKGCRVDKNMQGIQDVVVNVKIGNDVHYVKMMVEVENGKVKIIDTIDWIYKQFVDITNEYVREFHGYKKSVEIYKLILDNLKEQIKEQIKEEGNLFAMVKRMSLWLYGILTNKKIETSKDVDKYLDDLIGIWNDFVRGVQTEILECKYNETTKNFDYIGYYVADLGFEYDGAFEKIENIDLSNPFTRAGRLFYIEKKFNTAIQKLESLGEFKKS